MFETVKSQMIAKWLEYEDTDIHPMLNEAECIEDLFNYYQEVLLGCLDDFIETYFYRADLDIK